MVVCLCMSLENRLFKDPAFSERERATGGARHLHTRGRWMAGEMGGGERWR